MVKERARFHRAVIQAKGVIHYENDIHVIRIRLGGHIAAKDDKSLQTTRTPREFVNMGQSPRANLSLTRSPTEAPHYLGPRGAMDARRQITVGVEFRQRHITLHSEKHFYFLVFTFSTFCIFPVSTQTDSRGI